ncbi:MAG: Gfo/Idh/MocA family oxidoreductase [Firmicutes bacterium]|nr:Gfo/Idh/MocA family oxidoreductase [Bacillota bacterium]
MKWGIISTGTIARTFARTVNGMQNPDETLAAVSSRSLDKAQAFAEEFGVTRAYGSYEEMMQDPDVDAVYIGTPNHLHYENAKMCLEAGKHVLLEKPMTTDAVQAVNLYKLAQEKHLFIMEAFWIRFLPGMQALRDTIDNGEIGELRHARVEFGFTAPEPRLERKLRADVGGGALLDIGIYTLGFLQFIMRDRVESFSTQVHFSPYGSDDFSVLQLCYPGGRTAHATQAIGTVMQRNAVIYGSTGAILIPDFQKIDRFTVAPYQGESHTVELPFSGTGYEYEILEVTRQVRAGSWYSNIFSPEDSLKVLRLLDEIREAWDFAYPWEKEE